ncbi:TRAP transporter substrate-binding protein [Xenophilus arseniciresistens]|uniref:TRAP transporter substrate-binding protein n=1 Tax=Xenophilus arseniciresistens TaxID=1283306 RepID=A0AAE3NAL3_9BURK|nr:TRAP transporter substrate-binding protein [Xenophilus arseniciresistens]MDA7419190.1 TRAP transporter substrate-binding protein [Xenophilus arseniciresistens]
MKLRPLVIAACMLAATGAAFAQDIQERVIKFGHLVQPGHPLALGTQKFAEIVAARSGGKLKVREYGASVLGSESQQIGALQGGVQEMFLPATTSAASLVKELSLIDTPFSFGSAAQVDALLQGPFGTAVAQKLPEKGLVSLGYWETGFRNITNSRKPVTEPEDVKGLKIRVMGNPLFLESFSALGTNPVPMAFGELYGALESRALDAQENPYSIVLTSKFYEVQKFMSVTNHVYTANMMLISKKFWDRLSPAEQKILQEAAQEAGAYQRKVSREMAIKDRKELEAKGMKVNDVPSAAIAKMREATTPVAEKFAAAYDPALVQLYRAEMKKIQATVH